MHFMMENVETSDIPSTPKDEPNAKQLDDNDGKSVQPAVDIVDHYATKYDSNECSDSTQPLRPPRKYTDVESAPSSRKSSETLDASPMKPSRKLSQSSTNRKFSTSSDSSCIRTPKKVSFSDELPLAGGTISDLSSDSETQNTSDYLNKLTQAMLEKKVLESIQHSSDDEEHGVDDVNDLEDVKDDKDDDTEDKDHTDNHSSSTISTQTMNELTKADMFPNSRKVSLHSERSFDMAAERRGSESASTQITTESENKPMEIFLENERKMSTTSVKCNYPLASEIIIVCINLLIFFLCSREK